jgi:hypothetical protein
MRNYRIMTMSLSQELNVCATAAVIRHQGSPTEEFNQQGVRKTNTK